MRKSEYLTKLGYDLYCVVKEGGYIKGYGTQVRAMDQNHHPQFNTPRSDIEWLISEEIVKVQNNVWVLNKELPISVIRMYNHKISKNGKTNHSNQE